MPICVADIPVGACMTFHFDDGTMYAGEVLHNYGAGIVLRRVAGGLNAGEVVEFNGQTAQSVTPMDPVSERLWLDKITSSHAEFNAMLASIRATTDS